ncbi:DNA invertase Pin-like site-specific DNA recombinase [Pseudarthrobacter oxydans]|uniref:DNA invertase Pin-like site-specific DNA recombinase n=1 Tax=Pseudarthrobacter oxydans TaxID=1671 RepID=A0AAW8NHR8_PSEOX|nr:recombinase family protein [Pseudarthrobacter oxydans]MDR7166114.1 DNA invertase Pin-like site-specific DNA recombinase [Pseudarthrobacter oxydans]
MVIIGYARISTAEQSAELQTAALREAGCDRIFTDRDVNGTRTGRPDLNNILDHLRPGDELVIWKLDRLGRSTKKLLQFIELLDAKGVTFRSLSEDITTTGPNGKAMLTILTALARLERDTTTERTQAGMVFAAAHGRQGGRPAITAENAAVKRTHQLKALGHKPADIGKMIGVSRATIYRYLSIASDGQSIPAPDATPQPEAETEQRLH